MYLILFREDDTTNDYSFSVTDYFHQSEGSSERGTFESEEVFRQYVQKEIEGIRQCMPNHDVLIVDLISHGAKASKYDSAKLQSIADELFKGSDKPSQGGVE
ncbi:conserved hypothetical protein [Vibrio crassostreae]|nr:conserved hypothetical protein [Vibrio chagasii]CAK2875028.1 conserved hypothetical protein [Vibrio crassostreae]